MIEGKILYTVINDTCVLKMTGSIIYTLSLDFSAFIEKLTKISNFHSMLIDMTEVKYIDSTNLGLLVRLHGFCQSTFKSIPTIISVNQDVNDILRNIGFDKLFTIVDADIKHYLNLHEVEHENTPHPPLDSVMLEAHRMLMKLNAANAQTFKDVVKLLEDEKNMHK